MELNVTGSVKKGRSLFDTTEIKQAALTRAALLSRTLGSNNRIVVHRENKPPALPVNDEIEDDDRSLENSVLDMNSSLDILDIRSITYKFTINELLKVQKDIARNEMQERQKRFQTDREQNKKKLIQEAQENLNRKSLAMQKDFEERLSAAMKELDLKEQQIEEEDRQRQIESQRTLNERYQILQNRDENRRIHERIDAIKLNVIRFNEVYAKLVHERDNNQTEIDQKVRNLVVVYDNVVKSMKAGRITDNEVKVSEQICLDLETINREFDAKVLAEQEAVVIAEEQRQKEVQLRILEEQKRAQDVLDSQQPTPRQVDGISQFISQESRKRHSEIDEFQRRYSELIRPLLVDESMKMTRFNWQKIINTTIVTICGVSGEHILDKYNKLSQILNGQPVTLGDIQINVSSHPLGVQFCTDFMAKRFVNQAYTLEKGNLKAVFPIASVIVSLWYKFPDFGKLFLANVYKDCPYLIPYYIPQFEGQTDEDYRRILGYQQVDGVLEQQDRYLRRMSGLGRLFAAVLITRPRRNEQNLFNFDNGWRWLANVLNLDPLPNICATLLLEVLSVTGVDMQVRYGKQFLKMVDLLRGPYFDKLNEGGPKARLKELLLKFVKSGRFDVPEGVLVDFW